jgi:hypothetical protein
MVVVSSFLTFVLALAIFRLASERKKKQFVASQNCEKACENQQFSAVFRFRLRA